MTRPHYHSIAAKIANMSVLPTNLRKRMRVIALREKGLTLQEIADEVRVTRQAVHSMLKRHARNVDKANGKA